MTAVTTVEVFVEKKANAFLAVGKCHALNRLQLAKFSTDLRQLHQQSALTLRGGQLTFVGVDG